MTSRTKALGHPIHPMLVPFQIPADARAKSIGLLHGLANIVVVVLFAVSWLLRSGADWEPTTWALGCSFVAVAVA
jgi:hypothetical protein